MKSRRQHDKYFTPQSAILELPILVPFSASEGLHVLECCSGRNDIADALVSTMQSPASIADALSGVGGATGVVWTNDLFPSSDLLNALPDFALDASLPSSWEQFPVVDWVVSNPPFSIAHEIVPLALEHARVGVAMLLRLSFLEPVKNRVSFLQAHPPTAITVLPRISFTDDGKTDSVTCAWLVWHKDEGFAHGNIRIAARR